MEALQGHRVVDVACGSGDAQTLCLTEDDTVWSWGDGDYGKLGRGGSDGCKVPMKVTLSPVLPGWLDRARCCSAGDIVGVWVKASGRPRGTEMSRCCLCSRGTPCLLAGGVEPVAAGSGGRCTEEAGRPFACVGLRGSLAGDRQPLLKSGVGQRLGGGPAGH